MLSIYKFIASTAYHLSNLFNRSKAVNGDPLWQGRLGLIDKVENLDIWIHAASMGEIKVIGHLLKALLKKSPELNIYLTAMTKTGYKTANDNYSEIVTKIGYFPIDHSKVIKRTLDKINPKLIVIAETEIWPNLVLEASNRNIPMIMVNGRMSAKAFGRYRRLKKTFSRILTKYNRIFVKSQTDADRYANFSVSDKVQIVGDMKFDAEIYHRSDEMHLELCQNFNLSKDKKWIVAGSTRPGEEDILLDAFKKIQSDYPETGLILAPRHLERLDEVSQLIKSKGFEYDNLTKSDKNIKIVLVDQMGQLNDLYKIAAISFVGGTLVEIGGHNLLEPVYNGSPVLYGSSVFNVGEADEYIRSNNFGKKLKDEDELTIQLINFFSGDIIYNTKENNDKNDSATLKTSEYILKIINET